MSRPFGAERFGKCRAGFDRTVLPAGCHGAGRERPLAWPDFEQVARWRAVPSQECQARLLDAAASGGAVGGETSLREPPIEIARHYRGYLYRPMVPLSSVAEV